MLSTRRSVQAILGMQESSLQPARDVHVRAKIARLERGGKPRVLDLFAGCGGLSLGLQRAGFEILAGLDSDPRAISTRGAPGTHYLRI
jgi:predicted RNA methylase